MAGLATSPYIYRFRRFVTLPDWWADEPADCEFVGALKYACRASLGPVDLVELVDFATGF